MNSAWLSRAPVVAAVAAIAAVAAYVAFNTEWETVTVPAPLGDEAQNNPFYAAEKLARSLGARPEHRYDLRSLDESTDVLVLHNWHWQLLEERRELIEAWVEAGGHLVVDNTLDDADGIFQQWSGVNWIEPDSDAEDEEGIEERSPRQQAWFEYGDTCGVLSEVDSEGYVLENARTYSVCTIDKSAALDTDFTLEWGIADAEYLQAVRVNIGDGSVTVLNLMPFGNRNFTNVDHGRLFVAATQLKRGTHIVFLSESAHPSLLNLIWMYGAPVVVLTLIALAATLWRISVRFGPLAPEPHRARRSLADQIRGTGRFAIRLGDGRALHVAAVRALEEAARRKIAHYDKLPQPNRIAAIVAATRLDADALANAINQTGPRRTADLVRTIALLENARRKLLR
jgi:hypothetical protein